MVSVSSKFDCLNSEVLDRARWQYHELRYDNLILTEKFDERAITIQKCKNSMIERERERDNLQNAFDYYKVIGTYCLYFIEFLKKLSRKTAI